MLPLVSPTGREEAARGEGGEEVHLRPEAHHQLRGQVRVPGFGRRTPFTSSAFPSEVAEQDVGSFPRMVHDSNTFANVQLWRTLQPAS